jgi:hypothetical protein
MRLLGGVVVMVMLLLTVADGDWASAEVTCSYDAASRSVTVQLAGTITVIERVGAGIEASGQPCGGATLANTDSIVVNGTDQSDELLLNESVARFAGVLFELHMSEFDYLDIYRGDGNDTITIGQDGIALDADGVADMRFLDGWPRLHIDTASGSDRVSGQGGNGTGAATFRPLDIRAVGGGDVIHGGEGNDMVFRNWHNTGALPDRIYGGGGDDYTSLIWTDDGVVISGGDGVDSVYAAWRTPVRMSLDGVANDGMPDAATNNVLPDVENLRGGLASDILTGDRSSNKLMGGGGSDVLVGGRGSDQLRGGGGDDQLEAGDGMADRVQGGNGIDSATVDCGRDKVTDVESATCAPARI